MKYYLLVMHDSGGRYHMTCPAANAAMAAEHGTRFIERLGEGLLESVVAYDPRMLLTWDKEGQFRGQWACMSWEGAEEKGCYEVNKGREWNDIYRTYTIMGPRACRRR